MGADGLVPVFGASSGEGLFDARFDVALGLAANRSQFGNHKVTGSLNHPLFAERKRLEVTQVRQMLEHVRYFENIP